MQRSPQTCQEVKGNQLFVGTVALNTIVNSNPSPTLLIRSDVLGQKSHYTYTNSASLHLIIYYIQVYTLQNNFMKFT